MKKTLKFLHEIGTVGMMGALAAQLVLSVVAERSDMAQFVVLREAIFTITEVILLPSLLVTLVSGLLAFGFHTPFHNATWAWIKALLTVLVLESTFVSVQAPAREAVALAHQLASGDLSVYETLSGVLGHERAGVLILLFLTTANVYLAVYRPRFRRRASARAGDAAAEEAAPEPTTR